MARAGIIGVGNISGVYLKAPQLFPILEIVACADLEMARAEAKAAEHNIQALTVEQLLADPSIEIVVNLTIPAAHAAVATAAVAHGKAVYSEKPLALNTGDGRALLEAANRAGVRLGCAPDTFLGGGLQTCRKLIDDGWIGEPVAATAFMISHGHESWHPNPDFYYQPGGGPMFDMGPYYLTALVAMLGPVKRVTGATRATFAERTITSQPKYGQTVKVEVPTHVVGVLDFAAGPIATIITTFDVWSAELPRIEIYGTHGTLSVPDPNTFGGPVRALVGARRAGSDDWREIPIPFHYTANSRGLGVADMAHAMRSGRPHRASGELAFHVLEIMEAIHVASNESRHMELSSTCCRPAPLPLGLAPGILDG
jgi:predicted dehydrogenase